MLWNTVHELVLAWRAGYHALTLEALKLSRKKKGVSRQGSGLVCLVQYLTSQGTRNVKQV